MGKARLITLAEKLISDDFNWEAEQAFSSCVRRLAGKYKPQSRYEFGFVPRDPFMIASQIKKAIDQFEQKYGKRPKTFIDVGCGIGNVMAIAKTFGLQVYGLEIDENLAKHAGKIGKVFIDNAFTWQTDATYDIVYTYQPVANTIWPFFQRKFEGLGSVFINTFNKVPKNRKLRTRFVDKKLREYKEEEIIEITKKSYNIDYKPLRQATN